MSMENLVRVAAQYIRNDVRPPRTRVANVFRTVATLVVIAPLCRIDAFAQNSLVTDSVPADAIVRVHLVSGAVEQGRLTHSFSTHSDSLMYCQYPAPPCTQHSARGWITRSVEEISALDLRARSKIGSGVRRGVLVGAGVGLGLWYLFSQVVVVAPDGFAVMGASFGALFGAFVGEGNSVWVPAVEQRGLSK